MVVISVDLWVCVIVQQLPILQTQRTIVMEHLIPSLLSIPITSPSNRMCNCVTVHCSHTCICIHVCSHISHTHTLTCIYNHHPLSAMLTFCYFLFLQDDSGWPLVESSLTNNKQLEELTLSGCDAFLANMGKALTKNASVRTLWLNSESFVVPSHHTHSVHSVCTSVNDMAMDSVPITSFLWESTHTHFPLCCMFLCVCQSYNIVQYRYTCDVSKLWVHATCYAAQCTVCTKGALLCPFTKCVYCVWDVVHVLHVWFVVDVV